MKRFTFIAVLAASAGIAGLSSVYAAKHMEGARGPMHHGKMMGGDSTTCMQRCGGGMGMGMGMMGMCMMAPRQIVAVDDGIVVAVGNRLIKYDKNLKKKKEVTIEFDDEAMKGMMKHMRRMHSQCRDMKKETKKK